MRILVAHSQPLLRSRLTKALSALADVSALAPVSDLTAAFHCIEHRVPDVVLIGSLLTRQPDFEGLLRLIEALGIRCIILERPAGAQAGREVPPSAAHQGIARVSVELTAEDLKRFIVSCPKLPASRHSFAATAGTAGTAKCPDRFDPRRIILIGSSTGGVDALIHVLRDLPTDVPPTLIVQHTGGSYTESLVRLLRTKTAANVQCAADGAPLRAGLIFIAPGDSAHLRIGKGESDLVCVLQKSPALNGHRPSVDALFLSAVPFASQVSAAILTGMGSDGAVGLAALRRAGAATIGQDAATSVIYGMPRVAFETGGVERQLPIGQIGNALMLSCHRRICD